MDESKQGEKGKQMRKEEQEEEEEGLLSLRMVMLLSLLWAKEDSDSELRPASSLKQRT